MILVDTDVMIWYLRGNSQALDLFDNYPSFNMSVVSYMELLQGMRNKEELRTLRQALREWNAKVLHISEEISAKAMFYVERHYLSHTLEMADALIAATAISYGLPLLTANDKHYRIIKEVTIRRF